MASPKSAETPPSPAPSSVGGNSAPKFGTVIPNRVFVGGISTNTTETDLLELFSKYGTVKATKVISDRGGVSKGYGFVTFETEEEARRLTQEADNIMLHDRKLNIAPAVKKLATSEYPGLMKAYSPRLVDGVTGGSGVVTTPTMFFNPAAAAAYYSQQQQLLSAAAAAAVANSNAGLQPDYGHLAAHYLPHPSLHPSQQGQAGAAPQSAVALAASNSTSTTSSSQQASQQSAAVAAPAAFMYPPSLYYSPYQLPAATQQQLYQQHMAQQSAAMAAGLYPASVAAAGGAAVAASQWRLFSPAQQAAYATAAAAAAQQPGSPPETVSQRKTLPPNIIQAHLHRKHVSSSSRHGSTADHPPTNAPRHHQHHIDSHHKNKLSRPASRRRQQSRKCSSSSSTSSSMNSSNSSGFSLSCTFDRPPVNSRTRHRKKKKSLVRSNKHSSFSPLQPPPSASLYSRRHRLSTISVGPGNDVGVKSASLDACHAAPVFSCSSSGAKDPLVLGLEVSQPAVAVESAYNGKESNVEHLADFEGFSFSKTCNWKMKSDEACSKRCFSRSSCSSRDTDTMGISSFSPSPNSTLWSCCLTSKSSSLSSLNSEFGRSFRSHQCYVSGDEANCLNIFPQHSYVSQDSAVQGPMDENNNELSKLEEPHGEPEAGRDYKYLSLSSASGHKPEGCNITTAGVCTPEQSGQFSDYLQHPENPPELSSTSRLPEGGNNYVPTVPYHGWSVPSASLSPPTLWPYHRMYHHSPYASPLLVAPHAAPPPPPPPPHYQWLCPYYHMPLRHTLPPPLCGSYAPTAPAPSTAPAATPSRASSPSTCSRSSSPSPDDVFNETGEVYRCSPPGPLPPYYYMMCSSPYPAHFSPPPHFVFQYPQVSASPSSSSLYNVHSHYGRGITAYLASEAPRASPHKAYELGYRSRKAEYGLPRALAPPPPAAASVPKSSSFLSDSGLASNCSATTESRSSCSSKDIFVSPHSPHVAHPDPASDHSASAHPAAAVVHPAAATVAHLAAAPVHSVAAPVYPAAASAHSVAAPAHPSAAAAAFASSSTSLATYTSPVLPSSRVVVKTGKSSSSLGIQTPASLSPRMTPPAMVADRSSPPSVAPRRSSVAPRLSQLLH